MRSRRMAARAWARLVRPASIARIAPVATQEIRGASARPITGGASSTTMSNCSAASSTSAFRRGPASSSAGLGGIGPLGTTNRLGHMVGWTASARPRAPVSRLLTPLRLSAPIALWRDGFRRSRSISRVRSPSRAKLCARAMALVDLPSSGRALVMVRTLGAPSLVENCRALRIE